MTKNCFHGRFSLREERVRIHGLESFFQGPVNVDGPINGRLARFFFVRPVNNIIHGTIHSRVEMLLANAI
jgi:hypothetical protein